MIWCSAPFRFIALSDAFTTGSSIMPQKRNPDAAELTRAKVGRIVGAFMALCTILKGLPLTYGKDMQEDKEPLFDAADLAGARHRGDGRHGARSQGQSASACAPSPRPIIRWRPILPTGWCARSACRSARPITSPAGWSASPPTRASISTSCTLAEMQAVEPKIDRGVYRVLTVEASVNARKSLGGTAPANVVRAVGRGAAPLPADAAKGAGDELLLLQERRDARRRRGARRHRGPGRHAVLLLLGRRPARGLEGIRRRHQGHERRASATP